MIKNIKTNSFYFEYKHILPLYQNVSKNYLIIDIYRFKLYNKLKKKLLKIHTNIYTKTLDKNSKLNIDDNKFISYILLQDVMSIFIINNKFESDFDIIFDSKSPFSKKKIKSYFNKKCIPTLNKNIIKSIVNILPKISKYYIKYYNRLFNKIKILDLIKYNISYEIINDKYIINLSIDDNSIIKKYNKIIKLPSHIFNHIIKLYNTNYLNNYLSSDILDLKVIEYIYIIYNRYYNFSSGNNQSSLLPSLKKILKDKLNIKVELFGSPLNTSSSIYGSLFYDIEHLFGSIGNMFNSNILEGYYELNPVFDKCLIDRLLIKCSNELIFSEKNNFKLLFLFILPYSFFKYSKLPDNLNKFLKNDILIDKMNFPYIRYSRNYDKTIVSPIVSTKILICHTSHISNYVKYNVINFNEILNSWIK